MNLPLYSQTVIIQIQIKQTKLKENKYMSSSENNQQSHEESSQCPECKKKYISSSSQNQDESQANQRIIIPLRKDLLMNKNNDNQSILKTLQTQIENLKQSNNQKDKMIEDLRKQIQHKITHYMIYGQINKQADEINKLKTSLTIGNSNQNSTRKKQFNEDKIRSIFREQSRKIIQNTKIYPQKPHQSPSQPRFKTLSTYDNYNLLKKQLMSPKNIRAKQNKSKQRKQLNLQAEQLTSNKEYYQNNQIQKHVFKISEAKKRIIELQTKISMYEKQILWMTNFVSVFTKTIQGLAFKHHQQQIIIPEWSLKKKAKTSWRYMKHLFEFLYSNSN